MNISISALHNLFKSIFYLSGMNILKIQTKGNTDIIDITSQVSELVAKSKKKQGVVNVFCRHTTAGIGIIEFEQGHMKDLKEAFSRIAPAEKDYHHNIIQNDDNGHSHIMAGIFGSDKNIPFSDGKLLLGTWQKIVLIEFDTHGREREVVVSVM